MLCFLQFLIMLGQGTKCPTRYQLQLLRYSLSCIAHRVPEFMTPAIFCYKVMTFLKFHDCYSDTFYMFYRLCAAVFVSDILIRHLFYSYLLS